MKLYHWTANKESVEKNGFVDGGKYSAHGIRGVWFADQVLSPLDGVGEGSELLMVEIPDDIIEPFEWKEQLGDSGYREWCIPDNIVNRYKVNFPITYKDRGIYKINEATPRMQRIHKSF